jgi:serine/threonine-protein kinase
MADVYEGHDERLARDVAVKMLRPDVAAQHPEVIARFEAEARSAARLSHPNVVAIFDTGEHEGRPFIVMERMSGETLAEHMAKGPVDLAWLRRVAGDVLGALGVAHNAGIVHRDIKPGNILIDENGCAKVADFGIAKSLDATSPDLTGTNLLVGTPAYMAPERVAGEPATIQADIYSLGVMLYEAAAGRKPFTGTTPVALAYAIRQGGAEPLSALRPDVDRDFAEVVAQAMAPEPAARFGSAWAMATALGVAEATDETLPVVGSGPDATMTMAAPVLATSAGAAPWWARREVRIAAAAALALVLVVAVLAGAGRGTDPEAQEPTTATSAPAATAPETTRVEATDPPTTEGRTGVQIQIGGGGDDAPARGDKPRRGNGQGKGDD